jgi:LPS export ABC transporter permease LptF
MELVVRHTESLATVLLLIACTLPPVLGFTLPMAVLVGVLIGLGRLSADSEIVALHASGIGLRRLLLPIGAIASLGAILTLLITFWLSPLALRTITRLEVRLLSSQAPYSVQPRVFDERFPHFVLYVQDVESAALRWRGVFLASTGGAAATIVPQAAKHANESAITIAENAQIIIGPGRGQVELRLGSGSTHEYDPSHPDQYNVTTFQATDIPVDLSTAALPPKRGTLTTAEQSTASLVMDNGPNWRAARVEFQRRVAFPAACLVFVLLGVPMGVRPRRGGRAAGLILTLILIGGYYFLFVSGDHMAAQGRISPGWGVWAANIVATALGLILLWRTENIRRPNRALAWIESLWARRKERRKAVPLEAGSNGPLIFPERRGLIGQTLRANRAMGFPMLIDIYLLQQFLYYFLVLLAGFVLIVDAFTLFDLLADIARNHIGALTILNYLRYLAPSMV